MLEDVAVTLRVTSALEPGQYLIEASAPSEDPIAWNCVLPLDAQPPVEPGQLVDAFFTDAPANDYLAKALDRNSHPILLDLRAPELRKAPWEAITDLPPLNRGWSETVPQPRCVFRYVPELADHALVPLILPIDVLVAELGAWDSPVVDRVARPLRHFRAVSAHRLDVASVRSMLRSRSYDIVHLRARVAWNNNKFVLGAGLVGQGMNPKELRRLLRSTGCRLLLLETDAHYVPTMLEIARTVRGNTGPAVIVATKRRFDFRAFYYMLTHDTGLDLAFEWCRRGKGRSPGAALLMSQGHERALSLVRAEAAMSVRIESELARADATRNAISERLDLARSDTAYLSAPPEWDLLKALLSATESIQSVDDLVLQYEHESSGMEPMADATAELADATSTLEEVEASAGRVVNSWFESHDGRTLEIDESLAANKLYLLRVNVGPRRPESNVREPISVPEDALEPLFGDSHELPLRVVLNSNDFTADHNELVLRLPRLPAASEVVTFRLTAPTKLGETWLRVAVYYRNNLLQSLQLTTTITETESRHHSIGNVAEVEWVLSGSLSDLESLEEKVLNVLTNETPNGTHTLSVTGSEFSRNFEIGETALFALLGESRAALQWVCGDPAKGETYNFEPDNQGSAYEFREHIASLAELGYGMFTKLITGNDDSFETELANALALPATIQGAGVKSAKYVFPLSLVYDHPLVVGASNEVCPDFSEALADGASAATLAQHRCLTMGCAHRRDTNVVCPSGFWGFRHTIEQPISSASSDRTSRGTTTSDVTRAIPVTGTAQVLMGYSEDLQQYQAHRDMVVGLTRANTEAHSRLIEIGDGLKQTGLHVVYFYCHGGRHGSKTFLGVGAGQVERLFPEMLKAWGVQWPTSHPLVIINGCNTVAITPADLLTFNEMLAWSKASGVIGAEITIPETLGGLFGERFLEGFLDGQRVGELLRTLRLELLANYNPLGLAYTAYCLAELHIEHV